MPVFQEKKYLPSAHIYTRFLNKLYLYIVGEETASSLELWSRLLITETKYFGDLEKEPTKHYAILVVHIIPGVIINLN